MIIDPNIFEENCSNSIITIISKGNKFRVIKIAGEEISF